MNNFHYERVTDVDTAVAAATGAGNSYLGGGTNLIDLWKYDLAHPEKLVDLNGIDELKEVTELPDGGLRLGALVTNNKTAYHPTVQERYPLLSRTILAGATPQIRNAATNGGNLLQRTRCYYFYDAASPCNKRVPGSGCPAREGHNRLHAILGHSEACIATMPSDMCVALAALEATVRVRGPQGERHIPFADFHRLPGEKPELDNTLGEDELILSIDLPARGFADHHTYLKLRDRHSYAFAVVSVALGYELDGEGKITTARIALGGVAHKPWRVPAAEELLVGQAPSEDQFARAADALLEGASGFKHNTFKIDLAHRAIIRAGAMAHDPSCQRPGAKPSL
ncbi:xanthine dehydrogenase YagS FAD-binding subunit [Neolewinella xylanilytica]|uniref:Xanthine dehydrogenase YagS FAD-binding subunit n=1 Tax=Neolewinella xylanilytica TaxID=1514080 RepID=A0A2S6I5Y0_9BACT|nr:xanthine dehydrogenase family protein subunit M [Neolewinella xylanilytica]PPK86572.1 xanthine dehydrogenase YagS FAD-binding subunit [Neolewinella xylanilytica]